MKDVDPIERELLLRQLQKEIKIMQILSHANIVTCTFDRTNSCPHFSRILSPIILRLSTDEGQVETNAHIYCFMELLTGGDVFEYLAENGPLSQIKSAYMVTFKIDDKCNLANFPFLYKPTLLQMYGVVSAIAYMHDLGIVVRVGGVKDSARTKHTRPRTGIHKQHRDMKAENLLLSNTHSEWLDAKIIDFGFSTILPKMSTTKSFLGTQG